MKNSTLALKRRIDELERASPTTISGVANCNCRERTYYHTASELEIILRGEVDVPCPTHGLRDLGELRQQWWAPWSLFPEDVHYCNCPPNAQRDFAEGKRADPPTKAEIDADSEAEFERVLTGQFNFDEDRHKAFELTDNYYVSVGRRHPAWTLVGLPKSILLRAI